jgi:predicted HD phosphohydrolase
MKTVSFTAMKDGTREDYEFLREQEHSFFAMTAERLLRELASQEHDTIGGYKVTRLQHALQSATRAENDGADTDWIVGALLHDIGDGLAPQNHDRMAAEIIRPFVREEVTWVVEHHGVFQMVYYAQHYEGWNQFEREKYRDHPCYQSCVDFCERWDQTSFDPNYDMHSLEHFAPMVTEVFNRKPYDPAVLQPGAVNGISPNAGS